MPRIIDAIERYVEGKRYRGKSDIEIHQKLLQVEEKVSYQ